MDELQKYIEYILPASVIIGALIAGLIIEKIIFAVIRKRAGSGSGNAQITISSMR